MKFAQAAARTNKPKETWGNDGWITQEKIECEPLYYGNEKINVAILGLLSKCDGRWHVNTSSWSGHKCFWLQVTFYPSIYSWPPSVNIYPVPDNHLSLVIQQLKSHNYCLPRPHSIPADVPVNLIIKSIGSGARWPGFTSQVHHFWPEWFKVSYLMSLGPVVSSSLKWEY